MENNGESVKDITYKATPEQLAEATVKKLESASDNAKQALKDKGYLDEDGNVPKYIKKKLEQYARHSQNAESKEILKNTEYGEVAKEAVSHTKASVGKIIAGQVMYYATPPLVYEVRQILKNKQSLDKTIESLKAAAIRIGDYIISKLKDIFKNVVFNSFKNFVKIFMDILISLVKATVRKMLRLVKNLVLSTIDAIRIIAAKGSSPAQKADAVVNLFGLTITTFVVDVLSDLIGKGLHLPEFLLMPLQIMATVICTNLTMLVLQKADLFDIRFGFKMNALRDLFENTRKEFEENSAIARKYALDEIEIMIEQARSDSRQIYNNLLESNLFETDIRSDLDRINQMFNMNIDFDKDWNAFIGVELPLNIPNT